MHEPDDQTAREVLTHHRLLGTRMFLHVRVRLATAGVIAAGALFARHGLGVETLDVAGLLWLALAVAVYNGVAHLLTHPHVEPEPALDASRRLRATMRVVIVLDYVALTTGIWLVGGARSPFLGFYLLHVVLGCMLLTRREAIAIGGFAYTLIVALVVGEWTGAIAPRLPVGAVAGTEAIDWRYAVTVLVVYGTLIGVAVFLVSSLSAQLRAGERVLRHENIELDRQSSLRRDFLHLALHDIQSMVGVVTANLRNMDAGLGGPLSEKHRAWVEASLRRLDGINQFLKEFRILETLESAPLRSQVRPVDLGVMLEELLAAHRDLAAAHRHTLELEVAPGLPAVRAIPELLREAIANYLTNAIKYTPDGGRIVLRAFRRARNVCVEVEDDGIGIAADDIPKLFTEFVRLDCSETPVAAARGTGLGLSIVRRIIERLDGKTGVRSEPGAGSTFTLQLPAVSPSPER